MKFCIHCGCMLQQDANYCTRCGVKVNRFNQQSRHIESDFLIENSVLKKYIGTDEEVLVPEGVKVIDDSAFEGTKNISIISFPDSVHTIGQRVFSELKGLEFIFVPSDISNDYLIPTYSGLKVYERSNTTHLSALKLAKLISSILNIVVPFAKKPTLNKMLDMDELLDVYSDPYIKENLKDDIDVSLETLRPSLEAAIKVCRNREEFNLLRRTLQHEIGVQYFLRKDSKMSFRYFNKASEYGNIDSTYNVACAYGSGDGVERDDIKSFQLMKKCAEAGIVEAYSNLSYQYENGIGTEINLTEARRWKTQHVISVQKK